MFTASGRRSLLATADLGSWWSRPCGGREVLAVALPLIVQTCFWSLMWFIDRLYLSWYSKEATAAALPGGMYHWTMICLPAGIASYANTFVAQYTGAGRKHRVGNAVQQAVWFGWATVPLFLLSIPLSTVDLCGDERQPRDRAAGGDLFSGAGAGGGGECHYRRPIVLFTRGAV